MSKTFREVEVAVISDVHLGTHASKAAELNQYLKSLKTKILVLNGDIIDAWRFSRSYFPKPHFKVVRQLIKMLEKGTEIFYITGNHDEFLRKFENISLGNFKIVNQLTLELNGEKTWIFHGDIFDSVIHNSKWLAKTGAAAYGFISIVNKLLNSILKTFGKKPVVLFKKIKDRFITEEKKPSKFEQLIARHALEKQVGTVICGHTHVPKFKLIEYLGKEIRYINSGDWVENFSAAEFCNGKWDLVFLPENILAEPEPEEYILSGSKELYNYILQQLVCSN